MEILFRSFRLEALCSNEKALRRKYGPEVAKRIAVRISDLKAADNLSEMRRLPGRCHELTGGRSGQLATDLPNGLRLVFRPAGKRKRKDDGGLDWMSVSTVVVIEIVDYH